MKPAGGNVHIFCFQADLCLRFCSPVNFSVNREGSTGVLTVSAVLSSQSSLFSHESLNRLGWVEEVRHLSSSMRISLWLQVPGFF